MASGAIFFVFYLISRLLSLFNICHLKSILIGSCNHTLTGFRSVEVQTGPLRKAVMIMGLIMLSNVGYFAPEVVTVSTTKFATDYITIIHFS